MPARPSRYRQSKAIDQTSQNVKDRIATKQAESKIKKAKRFQEEQNEKREQEREQVIAQQDGEVIKSTSILTGREHERDEIGVKEASDAYKTGEDIYIPEEYKIFAPVIRAAVVTGRGVLAPTEQITQPIADIARGVKAEDQAMPSSLLDLLITPIAAPLMLQKDFGFTDKDWYSPLGQVELWNKNESLPEFAQDTGDKRDFWQGMGDNLEILQTVLPNPEYHTIVNEGSFNEEGRLVTPGFKQVREVELQPENIPYYLGTAVGEIPYFVVAPMKTVQLAAKVAGTSIRVGSQSALALKNIKATASLKTATVNAVAEQAGNQKNTVQRLTKTENLVNQIKGKYSEQIKTAERKLNALDEAKLADSPNAKNLHEAPVTSERANLEVEIQKLKTKRDSIGDVMNQMKKTTNKDETLQFQEAVIREGNELSSSSVSDILRAYKLQESEVLTGINRKIGYAKNEIKILKSTKDFDNDEVIRLTNEIKTLEKQKQKFKYSNTPTADRLATKIENAPDAAHAWIKNRVTPRWSTSKMGVDGDVELTMLGRVAYALTHKREGLSAFYNKQPRDLVRTLEGIRMPAMKIVGEDKLLNKDNIPMIKQEIRDARTSGKAIDLESLKVKYNEPELLIGITDVAVEANLEKLGKNVYTGTMGPKGEASNVTDVLIMKGDTRQLEGILRNLKDQKFNESQIKVALESRVKVGKSKWSIVATTSDASTTGMKYLRPSPGMSNLDFVKVLETLQVAKSPVVVPTGTAGRIKKTYYKVKDRRRRGETKQAWRERKEKRETVTQGVFEVQGKGLYKVKKITLEDLETKEKFGFQASDDLIDEYERLRFSLNPDDVEKSERLGKTKVISEGKIGGDSAILTVENVWQARSAYNLNSIQGIKTRIQNDVLSKKEIAQKEAVAIGELEALETALNNKNKALREIKEESNYDALNETYKAERSKLNEMVEKNYDEVMALKYAMAELQSIRNPTGIDPMDPFSKGKFDSQSLLEYEKEVLRLKRLSEGEVSIMAVDDFIEVMEDGGTKAKLNTIKTAIAELRRGKQVEVQASPEEFMSNPTGWSSRADSKTTVTSEVMAEVEYRNIGVVRESVNSLKNKIQAKIDDETTPQSEIVVLKGQLKKIEKMYNRTQMHWWKRGGQYGIEEGGVGVWRTKPEYKKQAVLNRLTLAGFQNVQEEVRPTGQSMNAFFRNVSSEKIIDTKRANVNPNNELSNIMKERQKVGIEIKNQIAENKQLEDIAKPLDSKSKLRQEMDAELKKGSERLVALQKTENELQGIEGEISALVGRADSKPIVDSDIIDPLDSGDTSVYRYREDYVETGQEGAYMDLGQSRETTTFYYKAKAPIDLQREIDSQIKEISKLQGSKKPGAKIELNAREKYLNILEQSLDKNSNIKVISLKKGTPSYSLAKTQEVLRNLDLDKSQKPGVLSGGGTSSTASISVHLGKSKEKMKSTPIKDKDGNIVGYEKQLPSTMDKATQDKIINKWSDENKDYIVVIWDNEKLPDRVYHNGYDYLKLDSETSGVESKITKIAHMLDDQHDVVYGGGTFRASPVTVFDTLSEVPGESQAARTAKMYADGGGFLTGGTPKPALAKTTQKYDIDNAIEIQEGEISQIDQFLGRFGRKTKTSIQKPSTDDILKLNEIEMELVTGEIQKIRNDPGSLVGRGELTQVAKNEILQLETKKQQIGFRNQRLLEIKRKYDTADISVKKALTNMKQSMEIRLSNLKADKAAGVKTVTHTRYVDKIGWKTLRDLEKDRFTEMNEYYLKPPTVGDVDPKTLMGYDGKLSPAKVANEIKRKADNKNRMEYRAFQAPGRIEDLDNVADVLEKTRSDMKMSFSPSGRFIITTLERAENETLANLTVVKNWKTTRNQKEIEFDVTRQPKKEKGVDQSFDKKMESLRIMKQVHSDLKDGDLPSQWQYIKQDQNAMNELGATWRAGKWDIDLGDGVSLRGKEDGLPASDGWRIGEDGEIIVQNDFHEVVDALKEKARVRLGNKATAEKIQEVEDKIDQISLKAIKIDVSRYTAKETAKKIDDPGLKPGSLDNETVLQKRIHELEGELYENTITVLEKENVPSQGLGFRMKDKDGKVEVLTNTDGSVIQKAQSIATEPGVTPVTLNDTFFESALTQSKRMGIGDTPELDLMKKYFPSELEVMKKNGDYKQAKERVWNRLLFNQSTSSQSVDRFLIDMYNTKQSKMSNVVPNGITEIAEKKLQERVNSSVVGKTVDMNRQLAESKRALDEFVNSKLKVTPVKSVNRGKWVEAKIGDTETLIQPDVWSGKQLTQFLSTDQISILAAKPSVSLDSSLPITLLKGKKRWLNRKGKSLTKFEEDKLQSLLDEQGNVYPNRSGGGVQWTYIRTGKLESDIATGTVIDLKPFVQAPIERRTDTVGRIAEYFAAKTDKAKYVGKDKKSKERVTQIDTTDSTRKGVLGNLLRSSDEEIGDILKSNMEALGTTGDAVQTAGYIKLNTVREMIKSGYLTKGAKIKIKDKEGNLIDETIIQKVNKSDFKKIVEGDDKLLNSEAGKILNNPDDWEAIIKTLESNPAIINDGSKKVKDVVFNKKGEIKQFGEVSLNRIGLDSSYGKIQTSDKTSFRDIMLSYVLRRTEGAYPLENIVEGSLTKDRIRQRLLQDFIKINPSKKKTLSQSDKDLLERGTFYPPESEKKLRALAQKEFVDKEGKPKNLEQVPTQSGRQAIKATAKKQTDDPSAYAENIVSKEYLMKYRNMSDAEATKAVKQQIADLAEKKNVTKSEIQTDTQIELIMQQDILSKYGGSFTRPKSLDEILAIRTSIVNNKSTIADNNRKLSNLKKGKNTDTPETRRLENENQNLIQETKELEKANQVQTTVITQMNPTDFVNASLFSSAGSLAEGYLPPAFMAYGATGNMYAPTEERNIVLPQVENLLLPEQSTKQAPIQTPVQGVSQVQSSKVASFEITVPKLQEELKTGNVMDVVTRQLTPQQLRERVIQAPGVRTGLRSITGLGLTGVTYTQSFVSALEPPKVTQRMYIPREAPKLATPPKRPGPVAPFMFPPFLAAGWADQEAERQKKRKKKKAFWDVPDQWYKPGYWAKKPSSQPFGTGGLDRLGAGYTTFKSCLLYTSPSPRD